MFCAHLFVPLHLVMNDFTAELAKLHQLSGADFSRQVERIALRKEFHPLETDENIFSVGGEKSDRLLVGVYLHL